MELCQKWIKFLGLTSINAGFNSNLHLSIRHLTFGQRLLRSDCEIQNLLENIQKKIIITLSSLQIQTKPYFRLQTNKTPHKNSLLITENIEGKYVFGRFIIKPS